MYNILYTICRFVIPPFDHAQSDFFKEVPKICVDGWVNFRLAMCKKKKPWSKPELIDLWILPRTEIDHVVYVVNVSEQINFEKFDSSSGHWSDLEKYHGTIVYIHMQHAQKWIRFKYNYTYQKSKYSGYSAGFIMNFLPL